MTAVERMAMNLVAMAVAIVVGDAIANELSVATETRRDYTVHSHDKKVKIQKSFSHLNFTKIPAFDISCFPKRGEA